MKSSAFTIQQVTSFSPEIGQAIRDLAQQLGTHYQELSDSDLNEMIQSPFHFLFLARDKQSNRPAGMILLLVYRIPYLRKAHLDDLIVDEAFRAQGLGTMLLQTALTAAKEKGAAYVDFTSHPSREAANNLYKKLGFENHDTNVYRLVFAYEKV